MVFYYSNLDFYLNRSVIDRSCEDIKNIEEIPEYIFKSFLPCDGCLNDFTFYNCEYKTKICPLYLNAYSRSTSLRFIGIQNTFYKSNFPRFQKILNFSFNSSNDSNMIVLLDLMNMQNIELNSDILNEFLFSRIEFLRLFGDIVSIEKGLLKSFKRLKSIHIDLLSILKLMHNGIDWIFDLNSHINVDIQNVSLTSGFDESICVNLIIYSLNEQVKNLEVNFNKNFPDE
jgi:hypothetical protein